MAIALDTIRRWWSRFGVPSVLAATSLAAVLALRQTQGEVLTETFYWVSAPFRPKVNLDVALSTAANRELLARVTELQRQNRQLRQLLDIREELVGEAVPAAVVSRSADGWWQEISLGRGANHNVSPGDVVMAPGGLVGRVERVTPNTSRILLVSDPTSRVGVTLSRTRAMGVLRGRGSQLAVLEFFERSPDVQIGDTVVTSGFSSLYPASLIVGRIQSVDLDASPAPAAVVELSAPISLLEWGIIYSYDPAIEPTL
ncbi:rod shape-determining protein MreC [Synechococcus sp. PCC 7336]|uniref:rod shape-determining protein MreC n=1 Tax=Synechococcus sp. PCC 7336 TaxID=195250 RepID=UPI00056DAA77|nr:rod shape-determining protein MreC [Synechococcus sp. PCC 7336]